MHITLFQMQSYMFYVQWEPEKSEISNQSLKTFDNSFTSIKWILNNFYVLYYIWLLKIITQDNSSFVSNFRTYKLK